MYGVVSLLDEVHHERVEAIWAELKASFGIHGVHLTPIPHFTYHLAENYDMSRLDGILSEIAEKTTPFTISTAGLGLFTGPEPVLYITITINQPLLDLHHALYKALAEVPGQPVIAESTAPLYHFGAWQPHITLTHHDVDHDLMPEVIRLLAERDFNWQIEVNNLAVLGGAEIHSLRTRYPLGGAGTVLKTDSAD